MGDWYFGGMHWIWWGLWIILIFWIFLIPYPTPGQKRKKTVQWKSWGIVFARGEIDEEEIEKRKKVVEADKK